jgi:hypothetical protein
MKEDGIHKQWVFPDVTPTELEKRELLARMSEIAVRAIWKHFVYTFGGKLYLQRSGGPIGARVTMAVARLVMNNMGRKYRLILEAGGLRSFLSSVYVDDSRQKTNNLAKGMRYDVGNNKFEITQEAIEEDNKKLQEGEPISRRMARICQPIMNSVNCDLKFTTEVAEDFGDGRLPTLDFTIEEIHWMMIHSYFEKSMKTPYQVMERSAMSEQQRYSILSNELIRRMSKVHLSIGQEERLSIVEKFIKQLKTSGYSRLQAREAVVSGLVGMKRKMDRKHKLGEEMYRSAASTLKPRLKKKLLEKTSWYKDKRREGDDIGNDDDDRSDMMRKCMGGRVADKKAKQRVSVVKAVMFVPYTHGSRLAKKLREAEMTLEGMTGYRLKIVERGGRRLEDMLHKSDPWEGQLCGRQKCLPCKTKVETGKYSSQSCSKRSAVYETWCVSCEMTGMEEGVDEMTGQHPGIVREKRMAKYIGETARSTYERGFEHLSDLLNTSAKSHMLRHYVESHMGEEFGEMKFQMKVLKFTRTAFERQILESVLIQENRNHNLLNSKSEFNRCSIPRITLKMGESEIPRLDKKAAEELKREEWILSRIRDLRKGNGRKRGNARGNPVRKKIRLDEEHIECKSDKMASVIPDYESSDVRNDMSNRKRESDVSTEITVRPAKRQKMILDYMISHGRGSVKVIPDCETDQGTVSGRSTDERGSTGYVIQGDYIEESGLEKIIPECEIIPYFEMVKVVPDYGESEGGTVNEGQGLEVLDSQGGPLQATGGFTSQAANSRGGIFTSLAGKSEGANFPV